MPKIKTLDIAKAIHASLKDKAGAELSHTLENVVLFLSKKNLFSKVSEILEHLQILEDADNNIVRAKVTSRNELSEHSVRKLREMLKERYNAGSVSLELEEDKSLLGGIRIEGKGEVIDLSLKNKISQLQEFLLAN